jgi:hypothetical protein
MYIFCVVLSSAMKRNVEFEVLTAVIMNGIIFCNITPLDIVPAPYMNWCCQENLQTGFYLLREHIYHTRRELNAVYLELLELRLRLAGDLSTDDWNLTDRTTTEKSRVTENGKLSQVL